MEQILNFILFGFVAVWMLAWVWAIWRWSSDGLHGLSRGATTETNIRIIAWSAFYALVALLPLFVFLVVRARFEATFPG